MLDISSNSATESPPTSTARRPPGRPFEPGTSPNPGGKPKVAPDPGQLARKHTVACIKALARALTGPDLGASVAAAQVLLNEAYGLPRQHIAVGMPNLTAIIRGPTERETAHANGEAPVWNA